VLAQAAILSRSTFHRVFKAVTGSRRKPMRLPIVARACATSSRARHVTAAIYGAGFNSKRPFPPPRLICSA